MKISRIILIFLLTFLSAQASAQAEAANRPVRIAAVNIADDMLKPLIDQFHKSGSTRVKIVYTGNDPFSVARAGEADMVIAHYGHPVVQGFVEAGYGLFPRPVFANQVAIIGPAIDPAKIKGLSDGAEAIRRIANAGEKIHTNGHGANYLLDLLSISAGMQGNADFVIKSDLAGKAAIQSAAKQGAYIIWGVPPFIRQPSISSGMDILVSADPAFQRIMVSILANPDRITGARAAEAREFERYLLSPAAQALVRAFRYPGHEAQFWWPAARHNSQTD